MERKIKIKEFNEDVKRYDETHPLKKTYKGKRNAALNKARKNGKFCKSSSRESNNITSPNKISQDL